MDGRILRRGIISSCQSAATSKIVERFWSPARSAIGSSAGLLPVPLPLQVYEPIISHIYRVKTVGCERFFSSTV